jgi:hypothetical protein
MLSCIRRRSGNVNEQNLELVSADLLYENVKPRIGRSFNPKPFNVRFPSKPSRCPLPKIDKITLKQQLDIVRLTWKRVAPGSVFRKQSPDERLLELS